MGRGRRMGKWRVLSNVVVSQVDIFAEYGGVIPEVAARSHLEAILPVVHQAMREAGGGERGALEAMVMRVELGARVAPAALMA